MEYEFEAIAKELVTSRLNDSTNAPSVAADVARAILVPAIANTRAHQDPRLTVVSVCRGVMEGLRLGGKDLPKSAVALLEQMSPVAQESYLDTSVCRFWAMEAIAPICRQEFEAVRAAIEKSRAGDGAVFDKAVQSAGNR
ncbi:MAG: hypothetical protein AAB262_12400 [Elusimicrobiota bacterium]